MINNKNNINGFVLLYAVLLVSIVLTISLSLFDISYRQIILASTVENSQKAFYVMDSTRDCIRMWDNYYTACLEDSATGNCFWGSGGSPTDEPPPSTIFSGSRQSFFGINKVNWTPGNSLVVTPNENLPKTLSCAEEGNFSDFSDYTVSCPTDGTYCESELEFNYTADGTWAKVRIVKDVNAVDKSIIEVTGSNFPDTSTSLRRVESSVVVK